MLSYRSPGLRLASHHALSQCESKNLLGWREPLGADLKQNQIPTALDSFK